MHRQITSLRAGLFVAVASLATVGGNLHAQSAVDNDISVSQPAVSKLQTPVTDTTVTKPPVPAPTNPKLVPVANPKDVEPVNPRITPFTPKVESVSPKIAPIAASPRKAPASTK